MQAITIGKERILRNFDNSLKELKRIQEGRLEAIPFVRVLDELSE